MLKQTITSVLILGSLFLIASCADNEPRKEPEKASKPAQALVLDCESLNQADQKPGVNCIKGLSDLNIKPGILASDRPAPKELVVEDVVEGGGMAVEKGDVVDVNYVGSVWGQNREFDSSFERGMLFKTVIGEGEVIAGWDKGLIGMKEGGRRVLVIPPSLGYGAAGAPPSIPGNSTLIFIVDLVKIESNTQA